jgi:hypothetical protein
VHAADAADAHAAPPSAVRASVPTPATDTAPVTPTTSTTSPTGALASPQTGPQPVSASTNVEATAPAAATPQPPPPNEQLSVALRSLQHAADGSYRMRIELRPPELGRVELRVELRDGVLHTMMHAEHAHTAALLRDALDDLRARLTADGMRSGRLSVDEHGVGGGRDHDGSAPPDLPKAAAAPGAAPAPESSISPDPDALLDVRL